jgi:hypothetical protein
MYLIFVNNKILSPTNNFNLLVAGVFGCFSIAIAFLYSTFDFAGVSAFVVAGVFSCVWLTLLLLQ